MSMLMSNKNWLVGQGHPVLKNMKVNWDEDSNPIYIYIWENKIDGNQTTNQLMSNKKVVDLEYHLKKVFGGEYIPFCLVAQVGHYIYSLIKATENGIRP